MPNQITLNLERVMPNYKLNKVQTFRRILVMNLVIETIVFAGVVWYYDLDRLQYILLTITAIVIFLIFAVRAWNNPVLNE